jgi:hypothetical protein
VGTGKELGRFVTAVGGIRSVAWPPDGKTVAAACDDRAIHLWDPRTGEELGRLGGHEHFVSSVAFSPDGKLLASASLDHTVRLWDVAGRREVRKLLGHGDNVASVAFSPDGRILASGSWDQSARLWEVCTGRMLCVLPTGKYGIPFVTFSPDGRLLATAHHNSEARLWEVATGREAASLAEAGMTLAFSPDGKTLAAGRIDSTVLLWDVTRLLRGKSRPAAEVSPRDLEQAWSDLAGGDAEKAYQGIGRLVTAPRQSVPFLRERLRKAAPPGPELRKRLARLIGDLDADDFPRRDRARAELERVGEIAEPAVRRALAGRPTAEARRRLEPLLETWSGPPEASPDRLRVVRALLVLEQMDSPEARRLVADLAAGEAGAWLTREAQAAERRLRKRETTTP